MTSTSPHDQKQIDMIRHINVANSTLLWKIFMLKNVNHLIMSHYIFAIANSKQHEIMVIPVHKFSFWLKNTRNDDEITTLTAWKSPPKRRDTCFHNGSSMIFPPNFPGNERVFSASWITINWPLKILLTHAISLYQLVETGFPNMGQFTIPNIGNIQQPGSITPDNPPACRRV